MRLIVFPPTYLSALFSNWLFYVGLVFTVVDVYTRLGWPLPESVKPTLDRMAKARFIRVLAVLLLIIASVQTALDLQEEQASVPAPVFAENPDHAAELDRLRTENERVNDLEAEVEQLQRDKTELTTEVEQLSDLLQDKRATEEVLNGVLLLEERGRAVLAVASRACRMPELPNGRESFDSWAGDVRSRLAELGYSEYVRDFNNNLNCPGSQIPNRCLTSGFQSEFQGVL